MYPYPSSDPQRSSWSGKETGELHDRYILVCRARPSSFQSQQLESLKPYLSPKGTHRYDNRPVGWIGFSIVCHSRLPSSSLLYHKRLAPTNARCLFKENPVGSLVVPWKRGEGRESVYIPSRTILVFRRCKLLVEALAAFPFPLFSIKGVSNYR